MIPDNSQHLIFILPSILIFKFIGVGRSVVSARGYFESSGNLEGCNSNINKTKPRMARMSRICYVRLPWDSWSQQKVNALFGTLLALLCSYLNKFVQKAQNRHIWLKNGLHTTMNPMNLTSCITSISESPCLMYLINTIYKSKLLLSEIHQQICKYQLKWKRKYTKYGLVFKWTIAHYTSSK